MDEHTILEIETGLENGPASESGWPTCTYTALPEDSIRLMRILPQNSHSEICCETKQFHMRDLPEYTALSYTWGSKDANYVIILEGSRRSVRKNLWRFLHQAKELKSEFTGWLWIDALCINQNNTTERSQQVSVMPQIYSSAKEVLVWLGPSYHGSDEAMRELARSPSYWRPKRKFPKMWTRKSGPALLGLCMRPYWQRLWILQEIMLARAINILCGKDTVS